MPGDRVQEAKRGRELRPVEAEARIRAVHRAADRASSLGPYLQINRAGGEPLVKRDIVLNGCEALPAAAI